MIARLLTELAGVGPISGRHVVVTAHADDEVITFGGALRRLASASILQLTTGVPRKADYETQVIIRRRELELSQLALGCALPISIEHHLAAREVLTDLPCLLARVTMAIAGADVVWTHPYEHGHVDHDSAAWLVQRACERLAVPPVRMEFASYFFSSPGARHVFGEFGPSSTALVVSSTLSGAALRRKQAAIAAYASQEHIARKFPTAAVEHYRVAPVYDFSRPAPQVGSRWDRKGYTPSTTEWRAIVTALDAAREAA